jgi:FAD/FMN-containing dehydrogenase
MPGLRWTPTTPDHDAMQLLPGLERIVGADHVLADPAVRAGFEVDWTGRWRGVALAVVRPGSVDEVAEVVRLCRGQRVGIVPQGGNTGLVGGGVPRPAYAAAGVARREAIVLSTTRLSGLGAVDEAAGEVVAGAGVTLAALQHHAGSAGLAFGIDFGARDSATVGGMIATNAGGIHVLRHGTMREQLSGIEAVLGDGTIVRRLEAPRKDNTGYHLPSLLAGSEGTLGIVTAARVHLVPRLDHRAVAVLGMAGVGAAVALAARLRRMLPTLEAAELFFDDGLGLVVRHLGGLRPFSEPQPAYLLVEVADVADPEPALVDALAELADGEDAGVLDAAMAADTTARERLWLLREGHGDAIGREGVPHKLDVALPVGRLEAFVERVGGAVTAAAPGARTIVFGHVLDGNLHVNVMGPAADDEGADDAVLWLTLELGGSISAEHGIGIAKVRWLARDRAPGDLAAMRAIKTALDPDGILNPGVLLG